MLDLSASIIHPFDTDRMEGIVPAEQEAGPSTVRSSITKPSSRSQISHAEARMAIRSLDRWILSTASAEGRPDPNGARPQAQTVAQLIKSMDEERAGRPSRFSRLSGVGQLYQERARQRSRTMHPRRAKIASLRSADPSRSSTYRPFSLPLLLQRLSTFSISTYSNKPDHIRTLSPLGMALQGWHHATTCARDEVECVTCRQTWKVQTPATDVHNAEQAALAWATVAQGARDQHQSWCPWRVRSCSASLYRAPIYSVLEIKAELTLHARRLARVAGIEDVAIATTIDESDAFRLAALFDGLPLVTLLLALFGWQMDDDDGSVVHQTIIACPMCARRAGLWTYVRRADDPSTGKRFDLIREHKSYCPMVNGEVQGGQWFKEQDSLLPSRPTPPSAWQLRFQVLLGRPSTEHSTNDQSRIDARHLRSHEIVAKVKALLNGQKEG